MTAAARASWIARIDALAPWLPRVSVGIAVVVLALGWTFHAGRVAGRNQEHTRMTDSVRTVLNDTAKAIQQRMKERAPLIVKADTAASIARKHYAAAVKHIVPVTDSTVSIDGAQPVSEVAATLVIPALRTCDQAIVADTIDATLLRQQLVDAIAYGNTQRQRADLDEANAPKVSRFGFRSGVVAGVAVVIAVLHFVH